MQTRDLLAALPRSRDAAQVRVDLRAGRLDDVDGGRDDQLLGDLPVREEPRRGRVVRALRDRLVVELLPEGQHLDDLRVGQVGLLPDGPLRVVGAGPVLEREPERELLRHRVRLVETELVGLVRELDRLLEPLLRIRRRLLDAGLVEQRLVVEQAERDLDDAESVEVAVLADVVVRGARVDADLLDDRVERLEDVALLHQARGQVGDQRDDVGVDAARLHLRVDVIRELVRRPAGPHDLVLGLALVELRDHRVPRLVAARLVLEPAHQLERGDLACGRLRDAGLLQRARARCSCCAQRHGGDGGENRAPLEQLSPVDRAFDGLRLLLVVHFVSHLHRCPWNSPR